MALISPFLRPSLGNGNAIVTNTLFPQAFSGNAIGTNGATSERKIVKTKIPCQAFKVLSILVFISKIFKLEEHVHASFFFWLDVD